MILSNTSLTEGCKVVSTITITLVNGLSSPKNRSQLIQPMPTHTTTERTCYITNLRGKPSSLRPQLSRPPTYRSFTSVLASRLGSTTRSRHTQKPLSSIPTTSPRTRTFPRCYTNMTSKALPSLKKKISSKSCGCELRTWLSKSSSQDPNWRPNVPTREAA